EGEIRFRARQRQLDRPPLYLCVALFRRERAKHCRPAAIGLRLLELDVFAFEAPRHSKYSTGMPPLDGTAHRDRLRRSLRLDGGHLGAAFASRAGDADRIARGLWRRDPSV